jgi:hypothetical protein
LRCCFCWLISSGFGLSFGDEVIESNDKDFIFIILEFVISNCSKDIVFASGLRSVEEIDDVSFKAISPGYILADFDDLCMLNRNKAGSEIFDTVFNRDSDCFDGSQIFIILF